MNSDFLDAYENFISMCWVLKIRLRNEVKYVGKGFSKKILSLVPVRCPRYYLRELVLITDN